MNKQIFDRLFLFVLLLFVLAACRKQEIISDDPALTLGFSNDSIIFDTVFTSIGTSTQRLMIYNPNNKGLNISSIQLTGGTQSVFRLNIDGLAGDTFTNLEIPAHDSLFVFVRATINPQDASTPYVVEDDLQFVTNGNLQTVKLVAWGQDAVYILADQYIAGFPAFKIIADSLETVHWTAEKPYVVYGYALINSYGELNIEAGARIYFHSKSGLWAYSNGVLKVKGTPENPVTFQGDRLEQEYKDIPGQWDRIWLMDGRAGADHEIEYAIIRNGYIGIQAESFVKPTANKLLLRNSIIENHTGMGIFSRWFAIDAANVLIDNCGGYAMALTMGGDYRFIHSTIANYWGFSTRNNPSLFVSNYAIDSLDQPIPIPFALEMGNSVLAGSNEEEFQTDFVAGADSSWVFDHCALKTLRKASLFPGFVGCEFNIDPLFADYQLFDFHPDTLSPLIGKGKADYVSEFPTDLDGVYRAVPPDVGVYQFVPKTR